MHELPPLTLMMVSLSILMSTGCADRVVTPPADPPPVASGVYSETRLLVDDVDATHDDLILTADGIVEVTGEFKVSPPQHPCCDLMMTKLLGHYTNDDGENDEVVMGQGDLEIVRGEERTTFSGTLELPQKAGRYELRVIDFPADRDGYEIVCRAIVEIVPASPAEQPGGD